MLCKVKKWQNDASCRATCKVTSMQRQTHKIHGEGMSLCDRQHWQEVLFQSIVTAGEWPLYSDSISCRHPTCASQVIAVLHCAQLISETPRIGKGFGQMTIKQCAELIKLFMLLSCWQPEPHCHLQLLQTKTQLQAVCCPESTMLWHCCHAQGQRNFNQTHSTTVTCTMTCFQQTSICWVIVTGLS